ncbi:CSC1-like protein RXW8 isoform X1 [Tripterygium wilfordii]|uniref:CSC1-like protein RXW8 isoform X1 n=1 Tax=Tripterygium wilfordii TaxID=458696 RepID=A0A7J7DKB2_TRIWF|nr:CSC1-like protein RXW8 [Tripterygium wilfordii]KAF5746753.1 CSC1-like protein RXW8 isoform X1 [Tripterygium wilfordii]
MDLNALLTSAGINIGVSVALISLYSILRKQPSNLNVYFGRRIASERVRRLDPLCFDRFVPSPSWIVKAWETSEEEIMFVGGMDAVVFLRILVFSIRIFSIAAIICLFLVLPVNYYGQEMPHKQIPSESLEVFTIGNVKEGSKWLWAHCLALYIISFAACILLYFEYKSISKMRLGHIIGSPPKPSHFAILVRAIPWLSGESYSDTLTKFFTNYYASSYLSHQMVYRSGTVQKLMSDAEKMIKMLTADYPDHAHKPCLIPSGCCGGSVNEFKILSREETVKENVKETAGFADLGVASRDKECPAAFVFFKTRYAAFLAAQVLQSSNPMLWVTELAPEKNDLLWSNISIPYKQLWLRKIATLLAAIVFMFVFLIPVTLVQGLTQLEQLAQALPFLRGFLSKKFINQLVTGYLPSVILMLFLYTVPPTMMLFSTVEGSVSHSGRKKSACLKVLYFNIWNVFFVNVLSGSILKQLNAFSSVRDIPAILARAVPTQASFFMTYVLTSGWASLSCELMQIFPLFCNVVKKFILRIKEDSPCNLTFPYHTEVPRVLVFGLLGFTCSIMAPLILPFLLIYFILANLIYRNQILHVYESKYDSGGQYWPVVHNATIFSLVLTQIIALGVFGIKRSPVASGFTIPLVILTLLFNEYCRQRFKPTFKQIAAQILIEMDRHDEICGRMEDIYRQLHSAYCQFALTSQDFCKAGNMNEGDRNIQDPEAINPRVKLET